MFYMFSKNRKIGQRQAWHIFNMYLIILANINTVDVTSVALLYFIMGC